MAARQNAPGPPRPRQRGQFIRDTNFHYLPNQYVPEQVVFGSSISFEDSVYPALTRRDSIWSTLDGFGGADKLTGVEAPDCSCAPRPARMPSSASSVCLSSISRDSSVASVASPVLTASTSEYRQTALLSRRPSPLRNPTKPSATSSCHPGHSAQNSGHPYVCLWNSDGVCKSSVFATRDALNHHVKMEHLLECPVTGCTETCFESRDVLNCHMQSDHSNINASNAYSTTSLLRANTIAPPCVMPDDASKGKAVMRAEGADDKALKMEMSIGVSKKRCRDQLRTVLEKRLRRANGGLVKGADSPGMLGSRTPKLLESASFPVVWEHGILPFLIEFMPKWSGPGHVISVMRGRKPNTRRICIMTKRNLTTARRVVIAAHVRDLLPEQYRSTISFIFSTGRVDRLVWSRGLTSEMPDEVCEPRNPFAYISPCMGDSIGAILDDGEEATATLGPCVTAGGGSYWLACFHPFMGAARRTEPVLVEHPSPQDRTHCVRKRHDVLDALDHSLGRLTATSGFDLTTTRVTHDPYWDDSDKEPPLVVTDWTLISSSTRQANLLRRFPTMVQRRDSPLVTSTSPVSPCASVISTGRTSGFQRGQVGEVPAYLDGSDNGTGKATREWFIEEPDPDDDDNEWIRGGIGVEGDSGAAVIDTENTLVGQLWGRNKYWGPGPRITFFTPISDIFDDIQEKCGMSARPQLPQYRDEADRWPVYPVCKQCYDLREYLDSRRCSRESLMSMIGLHDARGEHDNDLTSVSELATPKDQSCIMRHLGPEDVTSPFGNGNHVSPALYPLSQTTSSPGMAELRSPYPQALNDEDLYDAGCAPTKGVAFGKRPAVLPPQGESTTQHDNKRRRTMYAGQG